MVLSHFTDESFDNNNCLNYTLSIQCSPDGFSFSVFDVKAVKFIALQVFDLNTVSSFELCNEIKKIISENSILCKQFSEVKAMYIEKNVMLVPKSLFNHTEINDIANFTFDQRLYDENNVMASPDNETMILSNWSVDLKSVFSEAYPNCKFYHPATPIIHFSMGFQTSQQRMVVSKFHHQLLITFSNKSQIVFLNTFFVKTDEDCLYYLFNIAKQLNANQETEILLLGNFETRSKTFSILKKFFKSVTFPSYPKKYAVSYTFMKEPDHFHIPLLELALCE